MSAESALVLPESIELRTNRDAVDWTSATPPPPYLLLPVAPRPLVFPEIVLFWMITLPALLPRVRKPPPEPEVVLFAIVLLLMTIALGVKAGEGGAALGV